MSTGLKRETPAVQPFIENVTNWRVMSTFVPISDALIAGYWLLCNGLLVRSAFRMAERAFPADAYAARLLHTMVLYLAGATGMVLLLGASGALTRLTLVLAGGVMAIAGTVLSARRNAPVSKFHGNGPLSVPAASIATDADVPGPYWRWIWIAGAGAFLGHVLVHGLLRLPSDFDSLMYHMPLIDSWLQAGSLYAPDCGSWFLAAGNEALGLWIVGPLSGDFLIGLNNLPIVVLWGAALYEICRQLRLRGSWPHVVTLASLVVHTLWHESDDASNDLPVAAYFLGGCCYALRYLETEHRRDLWLCGVCAGLLAGIKYFALGYAVVLVAGLMFCLLITRGVRASLRVLGTLALVGAVFGGYWYVRNWILGGSPVYPMGVSASSESLAYPNIWHTTFLGNGHPKVPEYGLLAVWKMAGPWHLLAVVLTPALCGYFLMNAFLEAESDRLKALFRLAGALWLAGSLSVLLVTPFALEDQPGTLNHLRWAYTPIRYGLCFLSLSSVALGGLLSDGAASVSEHGRWGRFGGQAAFCTAGLLVAWQLYHRVTVANEFEHLKATLVGVDGALVVAFTLWLARRMGPRSVGVLATAAVLAGVIGAGLLSQRWHAGWGPHFDRQFRTVVFDNLNSGDVSGEICVLGLRSYPFFGSRRQHHVFNPRYTPPPAALPSFAAEHDVTIIASRKNSNRIDRYRGAVSGLESRPKTFQPIETHGYWQVYAVRAGKRADRIVQASR